jgi:hypothetical protein
MNTNCFPNRTGRKINNVRSIDDDSSCIAVTVFKMAREMKIVGYEKRSPRWKKRDRVNRAN